MEDRKILNFRKELEKLQVTNEILKIFINSQNKPTTEFSINFLKSIYNSSGNIYLLDFK